MHPTPIRRSLKYNWPQIIAIQIVLTSLSLTIMTWSVHNGILLSMLEPQHSSTRIVLKLLCPSYAGRGRNEMKQSLGEEVDKAEKEAQLAHSHRKQVQKRLNTLQAQIENLKTNHNGAVCQPTPKTLTLCYWSHSQGQNLSRYKVVCLT